MDPNVKDLLRELFEMILKCVEKEGREKVRAGWDAPNQWHLFGLKRVCRKAGYRRGKGLIRKADQMYEQMQNASPFLLDEIMEEAVAYGNER